MDKNKTYAYLRIDAFTCTVEELTKRIGLQPTKFWHAGDSAPPPRPPRKFNAWHLRSRLPDSEEVEKHLLDVLEQVKGKESILREVAADYGITMECVGYFHEYYPGFALDADTVRRLGECNMSIDLDFYHFFTEKRETET